MAIRLKGYYWSGSQYTATSPYGSGAYPAFDSSYDVEFSPNPNEISKSIEPPWRTSELGLATNSGRRRLGKAKWRKKLKTEFTFTGECNGAMRRKLEWAASRWAKWLIYEDDINNPTRFLMSTPSPDNPISYGTANEYVYVVFMSIDFTQTSKVDWYRYTIKFKRVDKRDMESGAPGSYY